MSQELDYFPPKGTRYKWGSKALNYSPWVCRVWDHWPAGVVARVDMSGGRFTWRVEVFGWKHERTVLEGEAKTGLSACLAAEACAEEERAKLWLPWMDDAVKAGWRPPG